MSSAPVFSVPSWRSSCAWHASPTQCTKVSLLCALAQHLRRPCHIPLPATTADFQEAPSGTVPYIKHGSLIVRCSARGRRRIVEVTAHHPPHTHSSETPPASHGTWSALSSTLPPASEWARRRPASAAPPSFPASPCRPTLQPCRLPFSTSSKTTSTRQASCTRACRASSAPRPLPPPLTPPGLHRFLPKYSWPAVKEACFGDLPAPLKAIIPAVYRASIAKRCWLQGLTRLDAGDTQQSVEEAADAVGHLVQQQLEANQGPFMTGAAPCMLDALLFSVADAALPEGYGGARHALAVSRSAAPCLLPWTPPGTLDAAALAECHAAPARPHAPGPARARHVLCN